MKLISFYNRILPDEVSLDVRGVPFLGNLYIFTFLNNYSKQGLILMIFKALVVGQLAVNCYIIGDENTKEGMIVDPGGDAEMIMDVVRETGLTIKYLVVTHGHFDHCGALLSLKESLKCEILSHISAF